MGLNLNLSLNFHSSLLVRRKLFFCFKLWATTPNNMQQGVKIDAAVFIQQFWELLAEIGRLSNNGDVY